MKRHTIRSLRTYLSVGVLVIVAMGCSHHAPTQPAVVPEGAKGRRFALDSLQKVRLDIGGHSFNAWVMDTEEKQNEGLMFVKPREFPEDQAMLFSFKSEELLGFWMQNTEIPLDIAYFDKDRKLINVQKGVPFDESSLPSKRNAQYAVEANLGTFERLKIRPGAVLVIRDK